MKKEGARRQPTLQQFADLLAGRDDDKGGHAIIRTVATVAILAVLLLMAVETLGARLIDKLGLPHIPISWLMGVFVAISTIWAGVAAWQKRRPGRRKR